MQNDYMIIGGVKYRVEVNWNTITNFLAATGHDTLQALAQIANLKPSEISALIVEAIREGERLDGRDCNLTALDLGTILQPKHVGEFMDIYIRQYSPQVEAEEPAKKNEEQEGQ